MKICFPVQNDNGIESTVYNHFGSAPVFVVFDTDTNGCCVDQQSGPAPHAWRMQSDEGS